MNSKGYVKLLMRDYAFWWVMIVVTLQILDLALYFELWGGVVMMTLRGVFLIGCVVFIIDRIRIARYKAKEKNKQKETLTQ